MFQTEKKQVLEAENLFPGEEYHERATVQAWTTPMNPGVQQEGHGRPMVDDQVLTT